MEEGNKRMEPRWRTSLVMDGVGILRSLETALESSTVGEFSDEAREELRKSESIVRFSGVAVPWMVQFWRGILDGTIAPDLELFVADVRLAKDVPAGRTMDANGRVPHRKSGKAQRFAKRGGLLYRRKVQVTRKPREDWTISDVCDFVILPMVLEGKSFFTETLASEHVGEPFQGAFVSQARSSRFADLVAALTRHYTRDGTQEIPADAFVWLDLFCANQPLLTQQGDGATDAVMKERAALLTRGFHLAIEMFDERLFFFDSWLAPAPLKRMWCIWEIYGAIKGGQSMTVIFAPGEEAKFVDVIMDQPAMIAEHVADMRPDQAQCFDADDLAMIKTAVEGSVGWPKLKQMIAEQLNTWMLLETEESVKRVAAEDGGESGALGSLLSRGAVFMRISGQLDIGLCYSGNVAQVRVAVHGAEEHEDVTMVLGDIVDSANGRLDSAALEAYQRSLDIFVAAYGTEERASVADTLNNIAVVHVAQGKLDKALVTYQRSLDIKVAAYGTDEHTGVAETLFNMAGVYGVRGTLDKAQETLQRSLDTYVAALGTEEHPRVADALNAMAVTYKNQGKLDKALETYQRSLDIKTAAYGTDEHTSVAETLYNMGVAYAAQDKLDKALEAFQRSLDIHVAALGTEEHTSVAFSFWAIALAQEMVGLLGDALVNANKAFAVLTATLPAEHPYVAKVRADASRIAEA